MATDPANVTISAAAMPIYGSRCVFTPDSGAATATINNATLGAALGANNITVTTTNAGVSGGSAGTITITAPISWIGGNSLTLTADSTIAINAGITIGTIATAQLVLNAVGNVTQSAVIDGPGVLVKQGAGTFTASQANTYTGGTIIRNGTILLTNSGGVGNSGVISITPNVASTAIFDTGILTNFNNGSNIIMDSSAAGSTAQLQESSVVNLILPNAVVLTGSNNVIAAISNSIMSSGGFTGSGGLTVNNSGLGFNLYLNAANNTYSGTTTVLNGTFIANAANAYSPNSAVVMANDADARLEMGASSTIFSLAGGGAAGGLVQLDVGTLTIANSNPGSVTSFAGPTTSGSVIINLTGAGSSKLSLVPRTSLIDGERWYATH